MKTCQLNPLSVRFACEDPDRRCSTCPEARRRHGEPVPDEHKDARHVRDRTLSLVLSCCNCEGLVSLSLTEEARQARMLTPEFYRALAALMEAKGLILMPVEEAEELGRLSGMHTKEWAEKR